MISAIGSNAPKPEEFTMNEKQPADPNAELHTAEPLRIALALGALVLGLIMGIH